MKLRLTLSGRAASRALAAVVLGAATLGAATVQDRGQTLVARAGLETGEWHLRERNGGAPRDICVRNPAVLVQLRHGNTPCSHFVVDNTDRKATIHYTCPGRGHGRTTISVETPRLLQLQTQGVIDGAPFSSDYEARRTGACK